MVGYGLVCNNPYKKVAKEHKVEMAVVQEKLSIDYLMKEKEVLEKDKNPLNKANE